MEPVQPARRRRPQPHAPHIRLGRVDHALDVNSLNGAARRLASFLARHGAHPHFTVPPEPWHIELDAASCATSPTSWPTR